MSVQKEWQTDGEIAMDYSEFDALSYLPIARWVNMARNFALITVGRGGEFFLKVQSEFSV